MVTLSFTGVLTRGTQGALTDGYYRLTVDGSKIARAGQTLDANSDGVGGDNYVLVPTLRTTFLRCMATSTVMAKSASPSLASFAQPSASRVATRGIARCSTIKAMELSTSATSVSSDRGLVDRR